MNFQIRAATGDELDPIGKLYHSVWRETQAPLQLPSVSRFRNEAFFVGRARRFPTAPLVAHVNGRLMGFAAWSGSYLGQLYVHPDGRRLGLGYALLQAAEDVILADGFHSASLHCLVRNENGRRFYERCGWTLTATVTDEAETSAGPVAVACWEMTKRLKV